MGGKGRKLQYSTLFNQDKFESRFDSFTVEKMTGESPSSFDLYLFSSPCDHNCCYPCLSTSATSTTSPPPSQLELRKRKRKMERRSGEKKRKEEEERRGEEATAGEDGYEEETRCRIAQVSTLTVTFWLPHSQPELHRNADREVLQTLSLIDLL